MNSLVAWRAGQIPVPALGIFDVEFNELNPRICSSHLFQRTFAPSRDNDLVAAAKPRPMPEPPPLIKIGLPVRFIVYS
jgi:hypothetical protein